MVVPIITTLNEKVAPRKARYGGKVWGLDDDIVV
jgi:hypothetical protein